MFTLVVNIAACGSGGGSTSRTPLADTRSTLSQPLPTLSFDANPVAISPGQKSILTWSTSNVTSCTASGDWSSVKGIRGSFDTGPLNSSASFTLSCDGAAGGVIGRVNILVDSELPEISFSASKAQDSDSRTVTLNWSVSKAVSCEAAGSWSGSKALSGSESVVQLILASSFTLSCTGTGGTVSRTLDGASIPATRLILAANPEGVPLNGITTLTWTSKDSTNCNASGGWSGPKAPNGSEATPPISIDTTYQLSCDSPDGRVLALTTVGVRRVSLAWDAPTENTDGTSLIDLSGYRLYWGNQSRTYADVKQIDDPNTTDLVLNLTPGDYYFSITAVNEAGVESAYSNELSKTIL